MAIVDIAIIVNRALCRGGGVMKTIEYLDARIKVYKDIANGCKNNPISTIATEKLNLLVGLKEDYKKLHILKHPEESYRIGDCRRIICPTCGEESNVFEHPSAFHCWSCGQLIKNVFHKEKTDG